MNKRTLDEHHRRADQAALSWRLAKGLLTLALLLPASATAVAEDAPTNSGSAAPESPPVLAANGSTVDGGGAWVVPDRLDRMPNLMGSFFARGAGGTIQVSALPPVTGLATFTSSQLVFDFRSGDTFNPFNPGGPRGGDYLGGFTSVPYTGPKGFSFTPPPFSVQVLGVPSDAGPGSVGTVKPLAQNAAFTSAVAAAFPGAQFVSGSATVVHPAFLQVEITRTYFAAAYSNSFVYEYVIREGGAPLYATILLPNPAGGGLAGRNDYFENGSAIPRDRAYFYYSGVSDFGALGRAFNINRYTLGGEKTFCDGLMSVEARLPLASTADPTQSVAAPVAGLDHFVLGNLGLLTKAALWRTDDFILTAGFGVSVPTASDTRINALSGAPLLEVDNNTVLLQPVVALAWAPTERLFVQGAAQFDIDAFGNPVYGADGNGGLTRLGRFMDQGYAYLHGGLGYWVYQNQAPEARLSGVALLTELTYIKSMGQRGQVVTDDVAIAPLEGGVDNLNLTVGGNILLSDRASISAGVVLPVTGPKPYDWVAQVQLNWLFGRRR